MKALLNYEGFIREINVDEALPEITFPLKIYLGSDAPEKGVFKLIKICPKGIEKNGRWGFEKIAYYELKT